MGKSSRRFQRANAIEIAKVDDELGIVYGFAVVSKVDGEDYYDRQGDHIPEMSMMRAAAGFMERSRTGKEMHAGDKVADVLFAFPLTTEVAKGLGIETKRTGLLIGFRPHDAKMLDKFRSGEYTGFSIGGSRIVDEEVED